MAKSDQYCRTCLKTLMKTEIVISLDYAEPEEISYRKKLASCVPKLALEQYEDPVLCMKCSQKLNSAYSFHTMCLTTEDQLKAREKKTPVADYDKINQLISLELEGFIKVLPETKKSEVKIEASQKESLPDDSKKNVNDVQTRRTRSSLELVKANSKAAAKGSPKPGRRLKDEIEKLGTTITSHQLRQRKELRCNICGRNLRSKELYAIHMQIHITSRSFPCPHCPKQYFEQGKLSRHKIECHSGKTIASQNEKKTVLKESEEKPKRRLSYPAWTKKRKNISEGNRRGQIGFKELKALGLKTATKDASKKYAKCPICSVIMNRYKLSIHVRRHNKNYSHECDQCDMKFYERWLFTKHKLLHRSKDQASPKLEEETNSTHRVDVYPLENFESHYISSMQGLEDPLNISPTSEINRHDSNPIITAEDSTPIIMPEHIIMEDDTPSIITPKLEMPVLQDETQSLEISSKNDNYTIRLDSEMANEFSCKLCPLSFNFLMDIEEHIKSHHVPEQSIKNECINICSTCNMEFCDDEFLTHMETHVKLDEPEFYEESRSNIEDLVMEPMSEKMLVGSNLQKNKPTTVKPQPYFCTTCNRKFGSHDHANVHSGTRPYKCSVCGLLFGSTSGCQKHIRSKHKLSLPSQHVIVLAVNVVETEIGDNIVNEAGTETEDNAVNESGTEIGANVVNEAGVEIKDEAVIEPGTEIGDNAVNEAGIEIGDNIANEAETEIGDNNVKPFDSNVSDIDLI